VRACCSPIRPHRRSLCAKINSHVPPISPARSRSPEVLGTPWDFERERALDPLQIGDRERRAGGSWEAQLEPRRQARRRFGCDDFHTIAPHPRRNFPTRPVVAQAVERSSDGHHSRSWRDHRNDCASYQDWSAQRSWAAAWSLSGGRRAPDLLVARPANFRRPSSEGAAESELDDQGDTAAAQPVAARPVLVRAAVVPMVAAIFANDGRRMIVNCLRDDGLVREVRRGVARSCGSRRSQPPARLAPWLERWAPTNARCSTAHRISESGADRGALALDPWCPRLGRARSRRRYGRNMRLILCA